MPYIGGQREDVAIDIDTRLIPPLKRSADKGVAKIVNARFRVAAARLPAQVTA